jgi:hypothetical protein
MEPMRAMKRRRHSCSYRGGLGVRTAEISAHYQNSYTPPPPPSRRAHGHTAADRPAPAPCAIYLTHLPNSHCTYINITQNPSAVARRLADLETQLAGCAWCWALGCWEINIQGTEASKQTQHSSAWHAAQRPEKNASRPPQPTRGRFSQSKRPGVASYGALAAGPLSREDAGHLRP